MTKVKGEVAAVDAHSGPWGMEERQDAGARDAIGVTKHLKEHMGRGRNGLGCETNSRRDREYGRGTLACALAPFGVAKTK